MGGRRIVNALAAALVVAVVVACTSDDGTEVAGAALERGQDDEPVALDDPDDERTDPRTDADDAGVEEDTTQDDEGDAVDEDASHDDEPAQERPGTEEDADEDPSGTRVEVASDDVGPVTTSGSSGGSAAPSPPAPERLARGEGLRGDQVGFGPDGTEVLGSGPLESPPAVGVRADARFEGDDAVSCRAFLQAPQEHGLVARGELEVALDIEQHDGTSRRVPLMIMDLTVELAAGERYELPRAPSAEREPFTFDRDRVASLACVATFRPD